MASKKSEVVEIQRLDIQRANIRIIGDSPLIVHAWSEKAKRMMFETHTKATKTTSREVKDPIYDFINSLYWLEGKPEESTVEAFDKAVKNGAKWGFPVGAIKQAGNASAYRMGWTKSIAELRGAYYLAAEYGDMVEIKGSIPEIREDMVRVSNGNADIRYRGEFKNWYMDLILEYNASSKITIEQIINIINAGGYACGIGEWRPDKDGTFGKYHVEFK